MRARRTVAAGLALAALTAGACSSSKNAASDVKVTDCRVDPGGRKPVAHGVIHNTTSKDSGYAFRVVFSDGDGNTVSQGGVTVAKVSHGGTANWDASGAVDAKGQLQCKPTGVTRTVVP